LALRAEEEEVSAATKKPCIDSFRKSFSKQKNKRKERNRKYNNDR